MTGIPVAELPNLDKSILKTPTIFQYAKKAGYETYYIDAQMAGPGLQNYMSPNDLPYLDHFVRIADSLPRKRYFERDMSILDWIQKISKSSHKTFVVKMCIRDSINSIPMTRNDINHGFSILSNYSITNYKLVDTLF